jgi:hypothetical protein
MQLLENRIFAFIAERTLLWACTRKKRKEKKKSKRKVCLTVIREKGFLILIKVDRAARIGGPKGIVIRFCGGGGRDVGVRGSGAFLR